MLPPSTDLTFALKDVIILMAVLQIVARIVIFTDFQRGCLPQRSQPTAVVYARAEALTRSATREGKRIVLKDNPLALFLLGLL